MERTVPRHPAEPDAPGQQAAPELAPSPTQAEADDLKEQAHGEGDEPSVPTTPPAVVDVPHVSGTGAVGQTLSCTMGNWEGEPTSYAYAWATDGTANGAAGQTYDVLAGDVGKSITCIVTATNAIGSTAAPPSNSITVA